MSDGDADPGRDQDDLLQTVADELRNCAVAYTPSLRSCDSRGANS